MKGQKNNFDKLQIIGEERWRGFIGLLALQNEELLKSNDQLKQQLDRIMNELNLIKRRGKEKAARKEAPNNRKRFPKYDLMTAEIYKELIKEAEGSTYVNARTKIAICILAVSYYWYTDQ